MGFHYSTLLYVSAAFGLGLVCPSSYIPPSDPRPGMKGNNYANKSPYIAAIRAAGIPYVNIHHSGMLELG